MENRVFYGEYSLAYWIELILTRKIKLPEYQRHFVWSSSALKNLMDTFKGHRFIPPVTLGAYQNSEGVNQNLIIDGQQRLTCILLAYLGIFPDKEAYKDRLVALANGEEEGVEEEDIPLDNILEWTFEYLIKKGKTKSDILEKIAKEKYTLLEDEYSNEFFSSHFLGFAYIVPSCSTEEQQRLYTKIFREINVQGVKLLDLESRRSLYYLNSTFKTLFEPNFSEKYSVKLVGEQQRLDFARYLCCLAAYRKHNGNVKQVAKRFSGRLFEKYIENYIYSVVEDDSQYEDLFGKINEVFPDNNFTDDLRCLNSMLESLSVPKSFSSIIDMDLYFFGLVYEVMYCHKNIDISRKDELLKEIIEQILTLKSQNNRHSHTPAQLQYLRARISDSINIYNKYSIER